MNDTDKGYDRATRIESDDVRLGKPDFVPANIVRDYGAFTLNLSAIDTRLIKLSREVVPWLSVRNAMLDGMVIPSNPDAPIEVKWTSLLNYVREQMPPDTFPAQSELHDKKPVAGLAESLITALELGASETMLTGTLLDSEHYELTGRTNGMQDSGDAPPRSLVMEGEQQGMGLARAREARLRTRHLSDVPADQVTESPYARVGQLIREIRSDVPNRTGGIV